MICAGIDAGSRAIKVVLIDGRDRSVLAAAETDQGIHQDQLAVGLFERLLDEQDLARADVSCVVATGYARNVCAVADTTITEITCHAVGVHHRCPDARTVVEIGGQDSKLLRLDADGGVRDFAMNDRCAAGTGRFIEMIAARLGVPLTALGELAAGSRDAARINSTCAVFAETEIIGLLAAGTASEDIVAGVEASVASRIAAMAGGHLTDPVAFTGGVARIPGMDRALADALGRPVTVVPDAVYTGALGAALLACRRAETRSPAGRG
jgi:predicted CoA-substrate-specific enzyme activase